MNDKSYPTLVHAFADSLEKNPEKTAIHIAENGIKDTFSLSYADLYQDACCVAKGFKELHFTATDRLIIALPTSKDFFAVYLGALLTGIVPVIVPSPQRNWNWKLFAEKLKEVAQTVSALYAVVPSAVDEENETGGFSPLKLVTVEKLRGYGEIQNLELVVAETDIVHLQATSGSTGNPKFAILRHGNIAANVHAIGIAIQHCPEDSLVTWLPFFHDMGIIGVSYALFWQCTLIAMDPINFIRNPISWLRLITRFSGTLSPAPNSAFQVCARLAKRRRFKELDLTSWRVALCGAEPVHEETLRQFYTAFKPYGFCETALLPVYGLAEATLAATIPNVNHIPFIESIDADIMESNRRYFLSTSKSERRTRMVSVGTAIPNHQIRIVREEGSTAEEREIGNIEFSGPSVIDGYWEDPQNTDTLKQEDGFLRTGDLGYQADGHLYITGRQKEILIINGRNLIPYQIEVLVEKVIKSRITRGVAACGLFDENAKTEKLHLIIEYRVYPSDLATLETSVRTALETAFGLTGVTIHWVVKGQIPKTTSGKIQYYRCRELIKTLSDDIREARSRGCALETTTY